MIMIHPGGDMRGGVRQDASSMQTLKLTDYEALRDGLTSWQLSVQTYRPADSLLPETTTILPP